MRNGAQTGAGGSWGDNGRLWRVVACVVRATAMRGNRWPPRGARTLTPVGHCAAIQSIQLNPKPSLTASFAVMKTS